MPGLDFDSLEDRSEIEEKLNPILLSFLSNGYKNIPESVELSGAMKTLIMKQGLAENGIEEIALEAAVSLGMN
jgi:hypothetical protein